MPDAYIFDAIRTPRGKGKPSGAIYEVKPIDLLGACLSAIKKRNELDVKEIEDLIVGCVTPVKNQGHNIAKAALLYRGWPDSIGGFQINRFGASGLEAVNLAAMKISSGWEELILAGGVESMSRTPLGHDGGPLLLDPEVINKIGYIPQGVAADLIATLEFLKKEDLDRYAHRSHQRANAAWQNGYFDKSIIPIFDRNGLTILDKDEVIRSDSSLEAIAALPAAFEEISKSGFDVLALNKYPQIEKIAHIHTAGNSSALADGASLVLVGSKEKGEQLGLKPRAKFIAVANVSTEPTISLTGAAPAALKALRRANMLPTDIDLLEMNESFASAVLKFQKDLDIDPSILNVNGGAIAMGHPIGATGAMLLGTLLDELERRDLNTGLVALSASGGMGVATIVERI